MHFASNAYKVCAMVKRRELSPHEKACAERANALWRKKSRAEKISQAAAASELGFTTSAFNQYINGKIPMNTDATAKIAAYLSVSPREINPLWLVEKTSGGASLESELIELLDSSAPSEWIAGFQEAALKMSPKDAMKIARFFLDRAESGL